MTWGMTAVAGATLISGAMGSSAAKEAAGISAAGAREAALVNKQMFDITNEQQAPYRQAGYTALKDMATQQPYLTSNFTAEDFAKGIDPGYQFRLAQGQKAFENQANRAGGLISGNAMQGMQDYTQGQASQEYGAAYNRDLQNKNRIYNTLAGIAGLGQTSLGQTTQSATTTAGNIGSANVAAANAAAGGVVGASNATTGAIQGLGNNYMMYQMLKPQAPQGYGTPAPQLDVRTA
jgi:hypothetical protein